MHVAVELIAIVIALLQCVGSAKVTRFVDSTSIDINLDQQGERYENENRWILSRRQVYLDGTVVEHYSQEFQGMRVFGYEVRKITLPTGKAWKGSSTLYSGAIAAGITLTEGQERRKVTNAIHMYVRTLDNASRWSVESAEAIVHIDEESKVPAVAQFCTVASTVDIRRDFAVILHMNGTVIRRWSTVRYFLGNSEFGEERTNAESDWDANIGRQASGRFSYADGTVDDIGTGPGGNEIGGKYFYGRERPKLRVTKDKETCFLVNEKVVTSHANYSATMGEDDSASFITEPYSFRCPTNVGDGPVSGGHCALNDLHFHATATANMLEERYNDSLIANPVVGKFIVFAHYGRNYSNAMYKAGAAFFGDGAGVAGLYPFTTLDVVAHEIGHGVFQKHSQWVVILGYYTIAGGLNEAFADMTSIATTWHTFGTNNGWIMGRSFMGENATAWQRCLDSFTPACRAQYMYHTAEWKSNKCEDRLGTEPHCASPVFSMLFYKLSKKYGIPSAYDLMFETNRQQWCYHGGNFEITQMPMCTLETAEKLNAGLFTKRSYMFDIEHMVEVFSESGFFCNKKQVWSCHI